VREKPITEVTLRKYEPPGDAFDTNIRRFLLSLGLIRPGDKNSPVEVILKTILTYGKPVAIRDLAKQTGISESGVRYHVLRLKTMRLVEGHGKYQIAEGDLSLAFKIFRKYALEDVLDRISDYAEKLTSPELTNPD